MSAKFQPNKIQVTPAPMQGKEVNVKTFDTQRDVKVTEFSVHSLSEKHQKDYQYTKLHYGSLAATDDEKKEKSQKDARFSLNPIVRSRLSIEDEEKRAIEEKVRARIAAIIDEVKERAKKEGYEEGLKNGHEEAYQSFRSDGQKRLEKIDDFVKSCETAREKIFEINEKILLEIIFQISKKILLKELSADREYLLRLSKELVDSVGTREGVRVKINPKDQENINLLKEGLLKSFVDLKDVTIESSEQVKEGGCIVETQWNAIDGSISQQLNAVYESLVGKEIKNEPKAD